MYAFKMILNGVFTAQVGPEGQLGGCDHHSSQVTPPPLPLCPSPVIISGPGTLPSSLPLPLSWFILHCIWSLSLTTQKLPPDSLPGAFSEETSLRHSIISAPPPARALHSLGLLALRVLPGALSPGLGVRRLP